MKQGKHEALSENEDVVGCDVLVFSADRRFIDHYRAMFISLGFRPITVTTPRQPWVYFGSRWWRLSLLIKRAELPKIAAFWNEPKRLNSMPQLLSLLKKPITIPAEKRLRTGQNPWERTSEHIISSLCPHGD